MQHTLVITRDEAGLARLRQYRPTTDWDTADFHRARIECSNPAACEVWVECCEDGHGDPEDYDYDSTMFHGVEHEYLGDLGAWCVPSPHCAAALCEWDIPDEIDTTKDGTYPVNVDWDDEWLIVTLIDTP